jgi:hypothetical protein
MAKRPAEIRALMAAFLGCHIDPSSLRAFAQPVYHALGARSNPDYFRKMGERLGELFPNYTLDIYEDRHHFDPPHRAEPKRLAARLRQLWEVEMRRQRP